MILKEFLTLPETSQFKVGIRARWLNNINIELKEDIYDSHHLGGEYIVLGIKTHGLCNYFRILLVSCHSTKNFFFKQNACFSEQS